MAEVDTSIYQQLGQQQKGPNFLEMMGQFAGVQQAMNANMLFQQQQRARGALAGVMKASTDPETGQIDFAKAATMGSQIPDLAFAMPEWIEKWVKNGQVQAETLRTQFGLAQEKQVAYGNATASLMGMGSKVTLSDVTGKINNLYSSGLLSKSEAQHFIMQSIDARADLPGYVKQVALQAAGAKESLDRVIGKLEARDVGGSLNIQLERSMPPEGEPAVQPVATLKKTLSPSEAAEVVKIPTPSGAEGVTTKGEIARTMGQGAGEGAGSGGAGGSVGLPGGTPAPQPAPGPKLISQGQTPGQAELQTQSTKNFLEAKDATDKAALTGDNTMRNIKMVRDVIKKYKGGSGTSAYKAVQDTLRTLGMSQERVDALMGGKDSQAAIEVAQKAMMTFAFTQARDFLSGLGQQSNMEFGNAAKTVPGIDMNPKAIDHLLDFMESTFKIVRGRQKYMSSFLDAARKHPELATFDQFENLWQKRLQDSKIIVPTDADALQVFQETGADLPMPEGGL